MPRILRALNCSFSHLHQYVSVPPAQKGERSVLLYRARSDQTGIVFPVTNTISLVITQLGLFILSTWIRLCHVMQSSEKKMHHSRKMHGKTKSPAVVKNLLSKLTAPVLKKKKKAQKGVHSSYFACSCIVFTFFWSVLMSLSCFVLIVVFPPISLFYGTLMVGFWWQWWLFPRVQGFGENVRQFIPHLHFFFFLKWRLACAHSLFTPGLVHWLSKLR